MSLSFILAMGVVSALLALVPAAIADAKGYSFAGFWVAGLFFVLPALVLVAVLPSRMPRHEIQDRDVVVHSVVARTISDADGLTPLQIAERTDLSHERVERELSALQDLSMAVRNEAGRWFATERARRVLYSEGSR